ATTTTAADGTYSFTDLGPGSYTVQEVVPTGYTQTAGNSGYTIIANSGADATGNNFANFQLIAISGAKYTDITGNGITADDTVLAGVTINLFKDGGMVPFATTTTAADGSYSFANLGPGSYTVQEIAPAGYTQTAGNSGYTIAAQSGTNSTANNFANFQQITISGTKYTDITGDGLGDGDTPLAGVTINLFKDGGVNPVATTTTDASGNYSFSNLGPGTYTVVEQVPSGYVQTVGGSGYTVAANSGVNSSENNFGNFQYASIHGYKFNDANGNGSDNGEQRLNGWTI